jgi:mRNA interferase RelE/StbE
MPEGYRIRYADKRVAKDLRDLPLSVFQRVDRAILNLRIDPRPPGYKKLRHPAIGQYRLRVGDWRIIYDVNDADHEVLILRVMHRRDVYRRR